MDFRTNMQLKKDIKKNIEKTKRKIKGEISENDKDRFKTINYPILINNWKINPHTNYYFFSE